MHPGVGAGKSWPGGEAKLGVAGSRILVERRLMPERSKGLVSLLRPRWSCVCWGDVVLGRLTCARMDLLSAMRSAPLDAISLRRTAVAIKCKDGIVFAVEKMVRSKMLVEGSNRRIHSAAYHVGIACAGFTVRHSYFSHCAPSVRA